jgi:threonine dehydrogenase-like Zn-dependent dehydrogenase
MQGKMKGFGITEQFKGFGMVEADIPQIGPMDALAEPVALAACTSDPHQVHAGLPVGLILGHEVAARIVEVGSMVRFFKPGDVVAVGCVTPDYQTTDIQDSIPQHSGGLFGGMNWCTVENGTFAEYFRIRQVDMNATPIPEGLSLDHAVMAADMCTTGFHGAELADIQFGDTVVVIGIGPVGLMAVAGAALRGAGRLIAVGNRKNTMELAKEYGATDILNYHDGDIDKQVIELLGGKKADAVIVAGGNEKSFMQAINLVKPHGHVSNINAQTFDTFIPNPYTGGFCDHKVITGGLCPGGRRRLERLFDLMLAGRLDPTKLITHRFHGFEHIADAYELMDNKNAHPDLIKPIVYID